MIAIAQHGISTTPVLVIAAWAVVWGVVGTLVTRRRPVA
jgi:hypothetical protein